MSLYDKVPLIPNDDEIKGLMIPLHRIEWGWLRSTWERICWYLGI